MSLETLTQGSPPPTHRPSKKEEARSLSLRNYSKGVDQEKLKAFSYHHVAQHIDISSKPPTLQVKTFESSQIEPGKEVLETEFKTLEKLTETLKFMD